MLRVRARRNSKRSLLIAITAIILGAVLCFSYLFISNVISSSNKKQGELQRKNEQIAMERAIEAKKREPVYVSLPNTKPIRAIVEDYSVDSSLWAIVNKTHSLSIIYVPSTLKIPDVATRTDKSDQERSVRSDIEQPLEDMFAAASSDGYDLMIASGYRSAGLQKIYFDSLANSVGDKAANQAIARPGQSEHQTGLAVDITTTTRSCYLDNCFATIEEGRWLAKNASRFGFILRYPEGKESITQYQYESWHYRYVGVDLAMALNESQLTLDEAWPYLQKALTTLKENGAID